jgi:hypothetical protein
MTAMSLRTTAGERVQAARP